jgi:hypothetical protein
MLDSERAAWVAHNRGRVRARNTLSKHKGARLFHDHNGRLLQMVQGHFLLPWKVLVSCTLY